MSTKLLLVLMLGALGVFALLDIYAAMNGREGDTLSEHITSRWWARGLGGSLAMWLPYHFLLTPNADVTLNDVAVVVLGFIAGVVAHAYWSRVR